MPTPDEIYEKVLREELDKGASQPVAKARANAARARADRQPEPRSESEQSDAEAEEGPGAVATEERAGSSQLESSGDGAGVPERVQRLLRVVRPEALQKVERAPLDRVSVWPHLMAAEAVAMFIVLALLVFFSAAVDAPLRTLANFNSTPNPSKAPWYFLGLQELLRYFHPQVAGVTLPTVIIVTLIAMPFIDRNPSTHPDDRKFAIVMFSFFVLSFAVLVTIGMFFRGPGFNFVFPWKGGIFFEL